MVTLDSRLVISPQVVSQELDGELVLLSLDRAEYYGLNRTGTRVWQWLAQGDSLAAIVERLVDTFEVEAERAREDVLSLAQALLDDGLVTCNES